ncbi:pleckstrin homology domain-containing family G member 4B isoform X2 [Gadus morhua]|uniref:Pleckstrin homology domain-containing family G member 4B n=1 Tax=Gadus morhua TaxID=8049 RepID=A0A8C5FHS7_GADMO|nr:pleckstrin homology domain-containing family G member 4B isoform X2 [Gadus morhua]
MHSRAKSRSVDNYLSIKDSDSLDSCIQSTLSALYPPFSASAPTVLWQLFSVVERQYRGDGLRCLLDFLLPAKRILQTIQQDTCLRFRGLLLYHEGWPLCIHEKVVLQLAPLHKVRLKQGDFYLQVVPLGHKTAKLVIKCLSGSGQAIAEIPIAESMYGNVFSAEFLQNVTQGRSLQPLQNCLLTTGTSVYRTAWNNVVSPLFVSSTADAVSQARCGRGGLRGQLSTCSTSGSTGTLDSHRSSRESLHSQGADSIFTSEPTTPNRTRMEPGRDHPPQVESLRLGAAQTSTHSSETEGLVLENGRGHHKEGSRERGPGSRTLSFSTDLSNPGPRSRLPRDSVTFESRRLFRKSYMEALQNPMSIGSSSESILEEGLEHGVGPGSRAGTPGSSPDARATLREHLTRRLGSRSWLSGEDSRPSTPLLYLQRGLRSAERRADRRSKSLERTNKAAQVKGHRERSSSGGSASISSKKLMNGYALRFGKLDLEAAFPGSERRSSRDETGTRDDGAGSDCIALHSQVEDRAASPGSSAGRGPGGTLSDGSTPLPSLLSEVNQELLESGALILPGSRDRSGRIVLQVCTRGRVWAGDSATAKDLTCLLCYYYSTLRRERREQGLTVLVDSRRQPPSPALLSSLSELQALLPNALDSVLFLVDKEAAARSERDLHIQNELVTSLKSLLKHIDNTQLTADLEGSFHYDHKHWLTFRQKIEPFARSCSAAIRSLQESIDRLKTWISPETSQGVSERMEQQRHLMKSVLADARLNSLRLEGGTVLARIRKEEACQNNNYRDAIDMVNALYNQVDEEVHELVILSNDSQKHLENLLEVCKFEEQTQQVKLWFSVEGEKQLAPLDSQMLSLTSVKEMRQSLDNFLAESLHQQRLGLAVVRASPGRLPGAALLLFKEHLGSVLTRVEGRKTQLDTLTTLYEFYDSANRWMEHCQDYSHQLSMESHGVSLPPAVLQILRDYHAEASKFSPQNFGPLNQMVLSLDSPGQLQRWNALWHQCQQTKQQLEETLANAVSADAAATASTTTSTPSPPLQSPPAAVHVSGLEATGNTQQEPTAGLHGRKGSLPLPKGPPFSNSSSDPGARPALGGDRDAKQPHSPEPQSAGPLPKSPSSSLSSSSHFPFFPGEGEGPLRHSPSPFDDTDSDCTMDSSSVSCCSEPAYPAAAAAAKHRKQQPLKKIMKKTLSYELTPSREGGHCHGDTSHLHGYTGVYIRGLEVTNSVSAEKKLQRPDLTSPVPGRGLSSASSASRPNSRHETLGDGKKQSSKAQHIMDEMMATEQDYVRSLHYVIEHYFPEMERPDLPQDLRGKRGTVFGNVEKLSDFHSRYFLKELESCSHAPLSVSSCFLRHEDQFGMYALYSKNKPQSDTLLFSHGNYFFKNKQLELGDKMDLASYLLKPIQRMSKYALLLKDLIKECSPSEEQELSDLRTAEEMVKFQLRHGNDLLAMDAIQGCDVNLKEQGQLRCQDEFIVWCGRRKYLRHVFLFEDLILFSKTRKIEGGYDLYIYKQSFKTAEIGLTESVGDRGLRFEIWFRRRKSQDTYVLQASSLEVKAVWTAIIGKILWRQALRNRELRMKEMVSMGIGSKPFMDIKPSDAAISDRAIDYIMKGSECRTRASIAVSSFDHSFSFKRPHSTISNSSTSSSSSQSSSSLLGSLNLHLYSSPAHPPQPYPYPQGSVPLFGWWPYDCIEEDEQEQDAGLHSSMMTEGPEACLQGPPGDHGITRPPGDRGDMGPPGDHGVIGRPGDNGVMGPPGDHGIMGPPGVHGVIGPPGDHGVMGPPGDHGVIGPPGDHGVMGPPGDHGVIRPTGDHGVMGPPGEHGVIGPPGDHGVICPPGDHGVMGPPRDHGVMGSPAPALPSYNNHNKDEAEAISSSGFLCSPTHSLTPPTPLFQRDADLQPPVTKYITAL